jgi:PEP-CTERM motif
MRKRLLSDGLPMLAVVVLAGAAVGARAATVTYSVDAAAIFIPATTASISNSPGVNFTDTSTLPQFNGALGTLTDATFSYNYAASIDAEGGGGAVGQVGGSLLVNGNDTGLTAAGGGYGAPGVVTSFTGGFSGSYDDPNLSADTGIGSVTFAWASTGDYITNFGSTVTLETVSPSPVSVTYTYSAVPEPASVGLIGAGVVALLSRRRRK